MAESLKNVFGISKDVLKSYVERKEIDSEFEDKLDLTDHHLVVFGETKVGKSHLRKKNISDNNGTIIVDCTKEVNLSEIYNQILYKAGIEITESLTRSIEEGSKLSGEVQASLLEFLKSKLAGEVTEKEITTQVTTSPKPSTVSVKLADELKKAGIKLIVLDDFHYLNLVEQYLLAYDLKMFYQTGIRFIIIGTKISSGYFEKFNGELSQRIDYIDATKWNNENFLEIKDKGCKELNIEISEEVIDYFIKASTGIVAVYQALLFDYCRINGVKKTADTLIKLDDINLAKECNIKYWRTYSEMYFKKIQDISKGGRKRKLQLYYYIVQVIFKTDIERLKKGLEYNYLFAEINTIHPLRESLNQGALTSVLNHIDDLQIDKDIFPKVFTYYDKRLFVVDSVFYYILKHFDFKNLNDVLPPYEFQIKLDEEYDELN